MPKAHFSQTVCICGKVPGAQTEAHMAIDGDFDVEMIAYNRHVTQRMLACGIESKGRASIKQLVEKMGYGYASTQPNRSGKELEIRNIVGLKLRPTEEDGTWKRVAIEIAKALSIEPDKLWPGVLKYQIPSSNSRLLTAKIGEPVQWLILAKTD